jgi:hypothetical protein
MRLNGWQRLWIVASASWAVVVFSFAALTIPPAPAPRQGQLASEIDYVLSRDPGAGVSGADDKLRVMSSKRLPLPPPLTWSQRFPRHAHFLGAVFVWGIPSVIVYLLGFGAAWVRRGFSGAA